MANKTQVFRIVMSNTGGPLDDQSITVGEGLDPGQVLKDKLLSMIEACHDIQPGDTFTVETL